MHQFSHLSVSTINGRFWLICLLTYDMVLPLCSGPVMNVIYPFLTLICCFSFLVFIFVVSDSSRLRTLFIFFQKYLTCIRYNPLYVQAACIPLALTGRDICGSAITGSGKVSATDFFLGAHLHLLLFLQTYVHCVLDCCFLPACIGTSTFSPKAYPCNPSANFNSNKGIGCTVGYCFYFPYLSAAYSFHELLFISFIFT